jgi:hypothetical protein
VPAHIGRGPSPEVAYWAGIEAVWSDVSMSHGVDTRNRAWEVQSTAQQLFAEAVSAKQTFFSTRDGDLANRPRPCRGPSVTSFPASRTLRQARQVNVLRRSPWKGEDVAAPSSTSAR